MGDGNETPKLQPPPRVPAAGGPDPGTGPGGNRQLSIPGGRMVRVAVLAALVLGLVGVFVFLPRWQEQRHIRLTADNETRAARRPPEASLPGAREPAPTAESITAETSPEPTPTATPRSTPSRSREMSRRQPSTEERHFVEAMSAGLAALEAGEWQAAQAAFEQASRLRPDAPEVADGLTRARGGQRRQAVADNLQRARELEAGENWRPAERTYTAVLAVDPESAVALEGRQRTEMRASLDEKLEFHLANPGRLATSEVFSDAVSALEAAQDVVPRGPRLEAQIARLGVLLERASTPVMVVLESDALTEIVVYRVGRLGTFTRRELKLKPGAYTVVGSRDGYRDVRLKLVVTPETSPKPLIVRCTESL